MIEARMPGGHFGNFLVTDQVADTPANKPKTPMTLSWAYGATSDYHVKEVMEIYDIVFRMTSGTRVLLTTPSGNPGRTMRDALEGKEYIEAYYGLNQMDYLKKQKDAHVFLYFPSRPASTSSTVIELQQMGLVGVFLADRRRPETLMPDYPYLAKGRDQMIHLLRHLLDHYFDSEVQDVITKQQEYNRKLYDPREDAKRVYQRLMEKHALLAKRLEGKKLDLVDLLASVTVGLPEVTLEQIVTLVRRESRIGLKLDSSEAFTHLGVSLGQIRHLMKFIGFRDTCSDATVKFVRESLIENRRVV